MSKFARAVIGGIHLVCGARPFANNLVPSSYATRHLIFTNVTCASGAGNLIKHARYTLPPSFIHKASMSAARHLSFITHPQSENWTKSAFVNLCHVPGNDLHFTSSNLYIKTTFDCKKSDLQQQVPSSKTFNWLFSKLRQFTRKHLGAKTSFWLHQGQFLPVLWLFLSTGGL